MSAWHSPQRKGTVTMGYEPPFSHKQGCLFKVFFVETEHTMGTSGEQWSFGVLEHWDLGNLVVLGFQVFFNSNIFTLILGGNDAFWLADIFWNGWLNHQLFFVVVSLLHFVFVYEILSVGRCPDQLFGLKHFDILMIFENQTSGHVRMFFFGLVSCSHSFLRLCFRSAFQI